MSAPRLAVEPVTGPFAGGSTVTLRAIGRSERYDPATLTWTWRQISGPNRCERLDPVDPAGLATDYLWKEVLTPAGLTDILEHYAQVVEEKDPRTGRRKRSQVWPRWHQLQVVKRALAHNAAAVIFAHNHPSGDPTPSQADRSVTQRLIQALALVDIRLLDHLVVGGMDIVSFAERGWL